MLNICFTGKARAGYWVRGFYGVKNDKAYIITARRYDGVGECFEAVEVIPESVGMYVNREDKNKQPIFAGDILQRYKDELVIVNWSDHEAMFNCLLYCKKRNRVIGFAFLRDFEIEKYEIIGNTYDNPELIKGAVI